MDPIIISPEPQNEPQPVNPTVPFQPSRPTPTPSFSGPNVNIPVSEPIDHTPQPQPFAPLPGLPSQPSLPQAPIPQALDSPTPVITGSFSAEPISPAAGAVIGGQAGPSLPPNSKPKSKKKKLFLISGLAALLLLISGGVVFGLYLPNQPNAVWSTGVNRSGKALTMLVNNATEKSKLANFGKSDIGATINATYQGATYKGDVDVKFDASKTNGTLNFASTGSGTTNVKLNAQLLAEIASGDEYPSIYFQISGLKSLGIDSLIPALANYDGKWISVDAAYLKSLGNVPTADSTAKKQITADDVSELSRAAVKATTDYMFTTDPKKAVFEKKSFVAKEKIDDVNTYHYKVGINKDHAKAYCQALVDDIYSTNAYKKLPGVNPAKVDDDKTAARKSCQDSSSINDIKDTDVLDLWVESRYKLIYKIRIPDTTVKDTYDEIGQIYKGGNSISLFDNYHDGPNKSDAKFSLTTNLDTATTSGTLSFAGTQSDNPYSLTLTLGAKPQSGDIAFQKPASAAPIKDVFTALGLDPVSYIPQK